MELQEVQQGEALGDQGQALLGVASLRVVYVCMRARVRAHVCMPLCGSPHVEVRGHFSGVTFPATM